MKIYVAGPMTGRPDWNFPAFADAADALRAEGYEVQSPHEFDLEGGFDPSGGGEDFDLRGALERDVEAVLEADGVALLDGWEESPGVAVEILTAASQGKPAKPVRAWLKGAVAALAAIVGIGFGVSAPPATAGVERASGSAGGGVLVAKKQDQQRDREIQAKKKKRRRSYAERVDSRFVAA